MAVTQQDYIKSDSKVKAAQSALATANDKLNRVDKNSSAGKSYAADAKKAQADLDAATKAAREYFDTNEAKIQAADEKKNAGKKAAAAAATESIIGSGRLTPEQIQSIRNVSNRKEQKPSTGTDGGSSGSAVGTDVEQTVNDIKAAIADADQFILDQNKPGQRSDLAQKLTDAGYYNGAITDTYDPNLAVSYKAFLNGAKAYNEKGKKLTGFPVLDIDGFLNYRTTALKSGKSDGGAADVFTPSSQKSSPTQAAKIINEEILAATGRDATPAEIKALTPILQKIEDANPQTRSGSKGGKYTYAGGINSNEIIRELITDPTTANFGALDKKTTASIIKSVGKLGLAEVSTQRKTDKTTIALDDIKKTAQANGLPLNDVMLQKYSDRLKAGETLDTIKKDIRSIVAATMPDNVKKLLDAGSDLDDVYSPYKTAMSSVLEVPFDKIDLNDPSLTGAITANGNMPLYEFKNALRKDPRWQYTDNARQTVSGGLSQVLKDFGFMG
jgi:hypothetical protein